MSDSKMKKQNRLAQLLLVSVAVMAFALGVKAYAAAPGIAGPTFSLTADQSLITQPDGAMVYSWGYGCATTPAFLPFPGSCSNMQVPGPTLIVNEGDSVSVTLTNNLPKGAGNTSIIFPGFQVTATGGTPGLLTSEAAAMGGQVVYTFTAKSPGTRSYYSGTQPDLQIEMGLYGAIIVLPKTSTGCKKGQYSLAASAYDDFGSSNATCYDREYIFQFAEMDPKIHQKAEAQIQAIASCVPTPSAPCPTTLNVATEPYHPAYFLINGRSMPDDMDSNFAPPYPHQPYNGNPHMHPGDQVLLRVIGVGRMQHPFHEHGNHVRVLARDGNLLLSQSDATKLAGPLLFTTTTTPGLAMDGIFYWTGRGLNWDVYDHTPGDGTVCIPDANGYYTSVPSAPNYYEWCADHDKPLETANGGPATLPDPLVLTNGLWYGGTPYLGPAATLKAGGPTPLPPGAASQNPNAGFAFMWHSHNEREITTNDIFPGGMMMMMIVDAPYVQIDETL
jgi:FtsP/CotA-like multicopper oxidase with cupredoxin domain